MRKTLTIFLMAALIIVIAACMNNNDDVVTETSLSTIAPSMSEDAPVETTTVVTPTPDPQPVIDDEDVAFELMHRGKGNRDKALSEDLDAGFVATFRADTFNSDREYAYFDDAHTNTVVFSNYDTQEFTFYDKSLTDPFWMQYIFTSKPFDEDYARIRDIYYEEFTNKRILVKVLDYDAGTLTGSHGEEISYVYKAYDYSRCSYFPYRKARYQSTGLVNVELYMMMPVEYRGKEFYIQANVLVDVKRGEYDVMLEQFKDVICLENFRIDYVVDCPVVMQGAELARWLFC